MKKATVSQQNKIVAVIQARMGASRLPGKVLKKIAGKTLIEWIYYRLSFCKEVDQIVLATSVNSENDILEDHAKDINLACLRSSEDDLTTRYYDTAKFFKADAVVRICADCPLVDPSIVDRLVKIYREKQAPVDFVCNNTPPTYPHGMDVEVISTKTLEKLDREVKDPLYREWLTMTIIENPNEFKIVNVESDQNLRDIRLTVDYAEDLKLIEEIMTRLHKEGEIFYLEDILNFLEKNPELKKINATRVNTEIKDNVRKNTEFQGLKKSHG